MWYFSVRSFSR